MTKQCKHYAVAAFLTLFIATGDEVGLLPTLLLGIVGTYFMKKFIETMEEE